MFEPRPFYHEAPVSCQDYGNKIWRLRELRWNGRSGDSSTRSPKQSRRCRLVSALRRFLCHRSEPHWHFPEKADPLGRTGGTRCPQRVGRGLRLCCALYLRLRRPICHPLSEKPIHPSPSAQRCNELAKLPVRAPRELASFFREFPHKVLQPGVRDADAVLGAAVA
jgi:hypothetical protein